MNEQKTLTSFRQEVAIASGAITLKFSKKSGVPFGLTTHQLLLLEKPLSKVNWGWRLSISPGWETA